MSGRSYRPEVGGQTPEVSVPNRADRWSLLLALVCFGLAVLAAHLASSCADRVAIERVYYNHQPGEKPPFEQVFPRERLERLVRDDLRKEAALKKACGVEITPVMLEAEVERINTTTRAPDILAEIKAALGDDPVRFANVFAKPILVERMLREEFDNDDRLHVPQRPEVEQMRNEMLDCSTNGTDYEKLLALLKRGHPNPVAETTW